MVNMFLAKLNLSKQHTPSWAVKRADKERNNSQMKLSLLPEVACKYCPQWSEDIMNSRKRRAGGRLSGQQ